MILLLACAPEAEGPGEACGGPGVICPFAGTGMPALGKDGVPATESHLYLPQDLAIGPDGRAWLIDWNNHRLRVVDEDGVVDTVAGNGMIGDGPEGPAMEASFNHPTDLEFQDEQTLVIAAWHNSRVERLDLESMELSFWVGDGSRSFGGDGGDAATAQLNLPSGIAFDAAGRLFVADQANARIRCVEDDRIDTLVGTGTPGYAGDGGDAAEAEINADAGQAAPPGNRILISPEQVLYIADTVNQVVRAVDLATMTIETVVGNGEAGLGGDGGPADEAQLFGPTDLALGLDGALYIADTENSCIRVVRDGVIDSFAGICGVPGYEGDGGPATEARLYKPYGVEVDEQGRVYVADTYNQVFRVVHP